MGTKEAIAMRLSVVMGVFLLLRVAMSDHHLKPTSHAQIQCMQCSSCNNPCNQLHSPPPPSPPPPTSTNNCPPPPSPPSSGGGGSGTYYYYSPPPPAQYSYSSPPPPVYTGGGGGGGIYYYPPASAQQQKLPDASAAEPNCAVFSFLLLQPSAGFDVNGGTLEGIVIRICG